MDMFKVTVSIVARGEDFSPSKGERNSGIVCRMKSEKDSLFKSGPKRGQNQGFGHAVYELDENQWNEIFEGQSLEYWESLKSLLESAKKNGATDLLLHSPSCLPRPMQSCF